MIGLLIGVLALGLLLGGTAMKRYLRTAGAVWRPGAGVLAVVALIGAAVLGLKENWFGVAVLVLIGGWLALSARRRSGPRASGGGKTNMGPAEAASILGVSETATKAEVQEAYLRLMRRAHPDSGGTSGLAAQLNAARETLLKKR